MIWFREGVAWIPNVELLLAQSETLKMGALTVQVESAELAPPLRTRITFDALFGTQRAGPLTGDVVHINGLSVSLQLDDTSASALLKLAGPLPNVVGGIGPTTGLPRVMPTGGHAAVAAAPIEGGLQDTLSGKIAGRVCLAVVPALVDHSDVVRPPPVASLIHVFNYLHQKKATGKLTVRGDVYTKNVTFKRGTPINVAVTPFKEDEQIGQILLKARWLTPHKLADVARRARMQNIPIGEAAILSGVLDQARLDRALAHQTYRRLQDLFGWQNATFEFMPGDQDLKKTDHPVAVPRLLHEMARDVLRAARSDDLMILLEAYNERFPTLNADGEQLKKLLQDEKAVRVCNQIFDGARTLRQAITASVLGRPKTVRLVLFLLAAKELKLHLDTQTALPQKVALQETLRMTEVQDYFQRLAVAYTVHPDDLAPSHERRANMFRPNSSNHRVDAKTSARIIKLLDEASMVLSTSHSRHKYRERILGKEKMDFLALQCSDEAELAAVHGQLDHAQRLRRVADELR